MNEKYTRGRECNECADKTSGLQASQDHDGHTLQGRQSSVLTNQCLQVGERQMLSLSEELKILPDGRRPTYSRVIGGLFAFVTS
jgi:hypothetical protein